MTLCLPILIIVMPRNAQVPSAFFKSTDVVGLAEQLLGKKIVTHVSGHITSGMIVETEAYRGPEDQASHAYQNKRSSRTETMFAEGGTIYIYLCYGIHHLLNIVTGPINCPHAILIRAIEPLEGVSTMMARRHLKKIQPNLTAGPGCLTKALGLHRGHNGTIVNQGPIYLEHYRHVPKAHILKSPRVGVGYAKEHQHLPWRFRIKDNPWTSVAS